MRVFFLTHSYVKKLVELFELEKIVIELISENDNAILETILGGDWDEIMYPEHFTNEKNDPILISVEIFNPKN